MQRSNNRLGYSLVELLVTVAIIAILVGVALPAYSMARQHAMCAGCSAHMRLLAVAFLNYAGDNNGQLPGRVEGTGNDKWPVLLLPYVPDTSVYTDPGDPVATKVPPAQLASDDANNSSFFFNGFNDLGFYTNPNSTVTLASLTDAGSLALLGEKVHGDTQYYMDFVEGNQNDILNKKSYFGGSNYAFADGSVQFITSGNYNNTIWLVDKSYNIPPVPAGH